MLCDDLKGQDRGAWEGGSRRGDTRIHMDNACFYTAEANTALCSNYMPILKSNSIVDICFFRFFSIINY